VSGEQKVTSLLRHQSRVWIDYVGDNIHAADVVLPSIVLAYFTTMSQKCKSASRRAIQVKNSWKIVGTDKKLDIISRLENVNELLTCCNVIFTHGSICTTNDHAFRITESAESGTKVFFV
jgi:hypothetical protein